MHRTSIDDANAASISVIMEVRALVCSKNATLTNGASRENLRRKQSKKCEFHFNLRNDFFVLH